MSLISVQLAQERHAQDQRDALEHQARRAAAEERRAQRLSRRSAALHARSAARSRAVRELASARVHA